MKTTRPLLLLAVMALSSGTFRAEGGEIAKPVSMAAVDEAIRLSARYLVNACGPDGKFVYEIRIRDGAVSPTYNIVRHAGAMYALAMVEGVSPDRGAEAAQERAAGFLRRGYIRPGPDFEGAKTLAVWASPPRQRRASEATLGATGLGLVGLAGAPDFTSPEELDGLGRFLLFLQESDGRFNSKYFARSGQFSAWGSLYYPGEASLALVSLYEFRGADKWLAAGEKALAFLARSRVGAKAVPADHWALIATARLFALRDRPSVASLRQPLEAHAMQICESILADQITLAARGVLNGGFTPDGRTTPTSTRLEGLLAALEFLPPDQKALRARVEEAVRRGIEFLLAAQIRTGRYAGGVPEAVAGAGRSDDPKIRIDYVQHFLGAMIRYRKMFARP